MSYHNFKLRRAQVIYTWGIGSNFDTANGDALMLAGLDMWDEYFDRIATNPERLRFHDIRLQNRLGVNYFIIPPEFVENKNYGREIVNHSITLPFIRFPQWHLCPYCKTMKKTRDLFLKNLYPSMKCDNCKYPGVMVPSRFICICEDGHIQDFPYNKWAHTDKDGEINICDNPSIRFNDSNGLDLKDIIIECKNCKMKNSLFSMKAKIKKDFKCLGHRPWLGETHDMPCDKDLHATLRNASSVHNPVVRKSLFIINPILEKEDEFLHKILDDFIWMFNRSSEGTIDKNAFLHQIDSIARIKLLDPQKKRNFRQLFSKDLNMKTPKRRKLMKKYQKKTIDIKSMRS